MSVLFERPFVTVSNAALCPATFFPPCTSKWANSPKSTESHSTSLVYRNSALLNIVDPSESNAKLPIVD